ncbi:MAG: hypothetical protein ACTSPD_00725 [Promethearchaeota archaeon]
MARKDKKKKKGSEMGWDAEDAEEAKEAEAMLGTDMDEGKVDLYDRDKSTPGIETYDEDTGKLEGRIILKEGSTEGLLALVKIIEEVNVEQDHNANVNTISFSGKINVENPSTVDRLWDIDITLKNTESTNLESPDIKIRELGTIDGENIDSREFNITGEAKSLLLIKEYINTLPNADEILNITDIETDLLKLEKEPDTSSNENAEVLDDSSDDSLDNEDDLSSDGGVSAEEVSLESFGISIDKENVVTFVIAMKSLFESPISNVKVVKNIPDDFTDTTIIDQSVGMANLEGNQLIWEIDELEPKTLATLKFTSNILVTTKDVKKTGTIEATFEASSSFAGGLGIEKFDAYTRNKFYVDTIERDEEPGVWDCTLVFENPSEFIVQLFNADVYAPEDETKKFIDIDPNDVPELPAGAKWQSITWQYESNDYPTFRKKLEFRVMPDFQTIVNGTMAVNDVELSIASITGDVIYSLVEIAADTERPTAEGGEVLEAKIIQVPTFKEKDVNASLKLVNNGSAPLNEITIIQQYFSDEFKPPTIEEIKLIINGSEIELAEDAVSLEEGNILKISLVDLKDSDIGMFEPEGELEFQYPIHCSNPAKDARFESEITYFANTYPKSAELEFKPVVPIIEAVHLRRKFRIGKEVIPIGSLGQYKIVLHIENIGDMPLQNLVLMDKVPDSFEYGNYSGDEPEITDEVGQDTLKWMIEQLEEGEKIEISYEITGTGEYSPSDAQLAL